MKIAAISILIGVLFLALCLGLSYLTAMDWEHEMADTETSEFFLKLTFLPVFALPSFLLPQGLSLGTIWIISAILNSFIAYSLLFTFTHFRERRRQARTQQVGAGQPEKRSESIDCPD